MSCYLEERHVTLFEVTWREFKIDWLPSDWILRGSKADLQGIKLRLGQDLIRLNKLVSKYLAQFNFVTRPTERAVLETWLRCFFQSLYHLAWKVRDVVSCKAVGTTTGDCSLFNKLFVTTIADSKSVNPCCIIMWLCLGNYLLFVIDLTISQKENSPLFFTNLQISSSD